MRGDKKKEKKNVRIFKYLSKKNKMLIAII